MFTPILYLHSKTAISFKLFSFGRLQLFGGNLKTPVLFGFYCHFFINAQGIVIKPCKFLLS